MKYLGYVQCFRDFYNFTPLYRVTNTGTLIYLTTEERQMVLPKSAMRNINISAPFNNSTDFTYAARFKDGQAVVMDFELKDLEDNINAQGMRNQTGYRISPYKAVTGGFLKPVSSIGCYYVVEQKDLPEGFEGENRVLIDIPGFYQETEILVHYRDGFFAGPFKTMHRNIDDVDLFQPQIRQNGFILEGFAPSAVKTVPLSMNRAPGDYDSEYGASDAQVFRIVQVKAGTAKESRDMIPEEELCAAFLRSLSGKDCPIWALDSVDGDVLLERFKEQSLSSGLSEEILRGRVKRLQKILTPLLSQNMRPGDLVEKLLAEMSGSAAVGEAMEEIRKDDPGFMDRVRSTRSRSVRTDPPKEASDRDMSGYLPDEEKAEAISREIWAQAQEENQAGTSVSPGEEDLQQRNQTLQRAVKAERERAQSLERENERLEVFTSMQAGPFGSFGGAGFLPWGDGGTARGVSFEKDLSVLDAVMEMNDRPREEMDREAFCQYLIKTVRTVRPRYTDNQILNIAICVAQNFLTVFAGDPGAGKTSACDLFAQALGLDQVQTDLGGDLPELSRYMPIGVERGWNSRKDWIGSFSALTGRFEESATDLYKVLKILDMEKRQNISIFPFLVLLDDANISPLEYYFSDFLRLCDATGGTVALGRGNTLRIPETLRFLATVNADHTTEPLSERLIDRSMVIYMPVVSDSAPALRIPEDVRKSIGFETLRTLIPEEGQLYMSRESARILDRVLSHMKKAGIRISPRALRAIRRYVSTASSVLKGEPGGRMLSVIVADYAVAQKILPKISVRGSGCRAWLQELLKISEEEKLTLSAEIVRRILEKSRGDAFTFFC